MIPFRTPGVPTRVIGLAKHSRFLPVQNCPGEQSSQLPVGGGVQSRSLAQLR